MWRSIIFQLIPAYSQLSKQRGQTEMEKNSPAAEAGDKASVSWQMGWVS